MDTPDVLEAQDSFVTNEFAARIVFKETLRWVCVIYSLCCPTSLNTISRLSIIYTPSVPLLAKFILWVIWQVAILDRHDTTVNQAFFAGKPIMFACLLVP
jgi:hypothetical protein